MKKLIGGVIAVLISGLFLFCPKVYASEELPKAGFQEWEENIRPVKELPSYILTDEDVDLLLRLGVCEAGEVDPEGIAYCMQVVLNRFESDIFPNTVHDVVFQTGQFTTTHKLAKANITPEAYEALEAVRKGEYKDSEALYFESLPGKVWSGCHEYLFSYGGHDFYK